MAQCEAEPKGQGDPKGEAESKTSRLSAKVFARSCRDVFRNTIIMLSATISTVAPRVVETAPALS